MEKDQVSKGTLLLLMIDKCNDELKMANLGADRQKFSVRDMPTFKILLTVLQSKSPNVPADDFIDSLSQLRLCGTFYNIRECDLVISQFEELNIDIPNYINNCAGEAKERGWFIDGVINKGSYKWEEEEKKRFNDLLDKSLKEYTYNSETVVEYLNGRIKTTLAELGKTESVILERYGYSIEHLFNIDDFLVTEYIINDLFFVCQVKEKTLVASRDLRRLLTAYLDNKNKVKHFKGRIEKEKSDFSLTTYNSSEKENGLHLPVAVASYGLMHVFWSRFDDTKRLTKTNCLAFATKYKISQHTLMRSYTAQFDKDNRAPQQKKEKKHLRPYFKRFENAVKMLETRCTEAFNYAQRELHDLKRKYDLD